jgi:predicted FMN-binding regulatory protein PaiB
MYIPAVFAELDLPKLHDFIEKNSFGLLVSQVDGLTHAEKPCVPAVAFSPDGQTLAVALYANAARLLDVTTGKVKSTSSCSGTPRL